MRRTHLHNPKLDEEESIDALEVFSMIYLVVSHGIDYLRTIKDPEYPMNLEQLNVIQVFFCILYKLVIKHFC